MRRCAHLLAVSTAARGTGDPLSILAGRPARLLASLAAETGGGDVIRTPIAGGTVWTVGSGQSGVESSAGQPEVLALSAGPLGPDAGPLAGPDLARRLARGSGLAELGAPFAAAHVHESGRLTVAADVIGLRHLYAIRGHSWAAVCTSARLLAALAQLRVDAEAMGVFRLTGYHLGLGTPFDGVTKLPPGCLWRLADGELTTVEYGAFEPVEPPHLDRFDAASAAELHGRTLRAIVEGCLDHDPDAMLELSGGFDSRLLLAAIPPARRRGVRALTIASADSMDAPVATALARRYGVRQEVVDLTGLGELDPEAAHRLVYRAAARHDCLGQPLSLAVLDWVEQRFSPSARLTGLAGEMARGGFFLQPARPRVEPALVDRIARWWITSNDAVPDDLLEPDVAVLSRTSTRERLQKIFAEFDTDWQTATDLFYLRERVHRWGGITATGGCQDRTIVAPSLDIRLLRSAFAVPQRVRRESRFAARVMATLDPDLAGMPMASGVRPASLSRTVSLHRRLGENTVRGFAGRAAAKAWQRVRPADHAPRGAGLLAQLVVRHWSHNPDQLEPALSTGLVRPDAVERLLDGTGRPSVAAIGFLMNLTVAGAGLPEHRRWPDGSDL